MQTVFSPWLEARASNNYVVNFILSDASLSSIFRHSPQNRRHRQLSFTSSPCFNFHESLARRRLKVVAQSVVNQAEEKAGNNNNEAEDICLLSAVKSYYNDILILETPNKSRMLLLDSSHNVHSVYSQETSWTGSYWDEFASLPAVVPDGPIAIFGLGAGTAARLMLELWPSLELEGWEIDEILIDKSREYLGLSDLEKHNNDGDRGLHIHIGDALSPLATIPGGYAGIVIDLFCDGKVLPQLQEVSTWLELTKKLMPNGRIMVNCGGVTDELSIPNSESLSVDQTWQQNSTLRTLCKAFPGQLSWKKMEKHEGENFLALTGHPPDISVWSAAVPNPLSSNVIKWRIC